MSRSPARTSNNSTSPSPPGAHGKCDACQGTHSPIASFALCQQCFGTHGAVVAQVMQRLAGVEVSLHDLLERGIFDANGTHIGYVRDVIDRTVTHQHFESEDFYGVSQRYRTGVKRRTLTIIVDVVAELAP